MSNEKTLIVESDSGGHRKEFIEYILLYLLKSPDKVERYIFLLNQLLINQIDTAYFLSAGIQIKPINKIEKPVSLLKRSIFEWTYIKSILDEDKSIRKVIFMNLDLFQYILTDNYFKSNQTSVSGILFQPYHHLPVSKSISKESLFQFLRKARKYLTFKMILLQNKQLNKVFILNDPEGADHLNEAYRISKRKVFFNLPDPIDTRSLVEYDAKSIVYNKYNLPTERKLLLVFGSIDTRKNVNNIVKSLLSLPVGYKHKIALLIAGKFSNSISKELTQFLDEVKVNDKELIIEYNNDYVSKIEMEELFKSCELVLMPYKDFYSSSGVIGHAVKYEKRVIASSLGIVKKNC